MRPTNTCSMNTSNLFHALSIALMLGLAAPYAAADDGHDHGDETPASAGPALPRFAAATELFELVGVLEGRRLSLYLDHAPDNRPVKDARLELEFNGAPLAVAPRGEGQFEAMLAAAPEEGVVAVTATVMAGNEADLLAGELDIHHDEHVEAGAATDTKWPAYAVGAAGAAGGLGVAALVLSRVRRQRHGGAA
jgi:hypothetical protein